MILDLAFALVQVDGEPLQSDNDISDKNLAPQHSMYKLRNVILPLIIHTLARAPDTGIPFLFSKVDLKDGYWPIVVDPTDPCICAPTNQRRRQTRTRHPRFDPNGME